MTTKLIILLLMAVCTNIAYATDFITFQRSSQSDIELTRTSDTITYDPLDWKGVRMAVENLRHDLKAVTGSANAPVVVATIGKSKLAKKYKLQSKELQGKWEQYLIFTDKGKLVILGSDKRGTIFGIYELSTLHADSVSVFVSMMARCRPLMRDKVMWTLSTNIQKRILHVRRY